MVFSPLRYFSFFKIYILLSMLYVSTSGLTELIDTTSGVVQKVIEGASIAQMRINLPYTETHFFSFDSVDQNNTLFLSHHLLTPYQQWQYPFYIASIQSNDKINLFSHTLKIHRWDNWFIWLEYLEEYDQNAKKPISQTNRPLLINEDSIQNYLNQNLMIGTDSSKLKEKVVQKAQQSYLFQDMNSIYKTAWDYSQKQQYQQCLSLIQPVLDKKNLNFFGLYYLAAIASYHLQQYQLSINYFDKIQEILPNSPIGFYGKAFIQFTLENYHQAYLILQQINKRFPEFERAYLLMAKTGQKLELNEKTQKENLKKSKQYQTTWQNHEPQLQFTDPYQTSIQGLDQ